MGLLNHDHQNMSPSSITTWTAAFLPLIFCCHGVSLHSRHRTAAAAPGRWGTRQRQSGSWSSPSWAEDAWASDGDDEFSWRASEDVGGEDEDHGTKRPGGSKGCLANVWLSKTSQKVYITRELFASSVQTSDAFPWGDWRYQNGSQAAGSWHCGGHGAPNVFTLLLGCGAWRLQWNRTVWCWHWPLYLVGLQTQWLWKDSDIQPELSLWWGYRVQPWESASSQIPRDWWHLGAFPLWGGAHLAQAWLWYLAGLWCCDAWTSTPGLAWGWLAMDQVLEKHGYRVQLRGPPKRRGFVRLIHCSASLRLVGNIPGGGMSRSASLARSLKSLILGLGSTTLDFFWRWLPCHW